jgi:hypothetical protein
VATENVCRPSPSGREGRIGLFAVFTAPEMERAFRQQHFREDLWLCCFLVIAAMARVSVLVLADYHDFALGPAFWPLLGTRLLFLLVSALTLVALRRTRSAEVADRLYFAWAALLGTLTVYSVAARPPDNTSLLLLSFGVVLVCYCVTPLTLARQALLALTYTAAVLYVSRWADAGALMAVGAVYALCHVFGVVTSWQLNYRRRMAYLGTVREADLRADLEAAAAEIRTLRGLLCICAWCKRIREGETWQPLEHYVQSHTHASFTHGICPDCLEAQVSAYVPSRR